jgi:hypothetical protein
MFIVLGAITLLISAASYFLLCPHEISDKVELYSYSEGKIKSKYIYQSIKNTLPPPPTLRVCRKFFSENFPKMRSFGLSFSLKFSPALRAGVLTEFCKQISTKILKEIQ